MSIINPFVHEFYIDLQNGTTQQREKKPLSQGDAYADKIVVHVQDGGNAVSLAGVGVSAKVIRYDGQTVPIVGHVEDGAACVVLDAACYAKPGDVRVSVALSVGEMVQTVLVLSMSVETSETSIIADNGVVSDLTEILTALADMRSATDRANSAAQRAEDAAERAESAGGGGGGTAGGTAIDTTLSVAGAAADAAEVGTRLAEKAFVNHASETAEHGMATADLFGHVKAAWIDKLLSQGREAAGQDPDLFYDNEGNLIGDAAATEEHLRGTVPNMWLMTVYNLVISTEFEDLERVFSVVDEEVYQLKLRVKALEDEVAALKGV